MAREKADMDWAPRAAPEQIRLLFESDARGFLDEELLDEVGYRLAARCKDILQVSEALAGRAACRKCSQAIPRLRCNRPDEDDEMLQCPRCGWHVTWGAYFQSISGRKLRGGEVVHVYREFVDRFAQAQTARDKILAIDRLIHEFHTNLGKPTKPVAVTVISGSSQAVKQLIEDLANR